MSLDRKTTITIFRSKQLYFEPSAYFFWGKVQGAARLGAKGLRASEREICLWEGLWEDLCKPLKNLWKPLKISEDPPSQRPFQRQISLSKALGPVAPSHLPLKLSVCFCGVAWMWESRPSLVWSGINSLIPFEVQSTPLLGLQLKAGKWGGCPLQPEKGLKTSWNTLCAEIIA